MIILRRSMQVCRNPIPSLIQITSHSIPTLHKGAATDTQNRDEIWGQTGDKRGTQPPATPRTALQKKSQFVINARENTCFSDIVGILENTLVAEEGLMAAVV